MRVKDFKDRLYEVYRVEDCAFNFGGYWCMVYRQIGVYEDNSPCFEEDYSTAFCIHKEDCNCENCDEVEKYIKELFADEEKFHSYIFTENILAELAEADEEYIKANYCYTNKDNVDIAESVLYKYHNLDLKNMRVADALAELSSIAEEMAEVIENFIKE